MMLIRRILRSPLLLLLACFANVILSSSAYFVARSAQQQRRPRTGTSGGSSSGICINIRPYDRRFPTLVLAAGATDSEQQTQQQQKQQDFGLQRIKIGDQDFWAQQKELADELSESTNKSLRQEQAEKFEKRRLALVGDTAYISVFIFCALWAGFDNPFTAFSYSVGASMGLAYTYGLGKSVETIGASIDDTDQLPGAGLGEARFAFLILLFVIVSKFRGDGLQEIPSIAGFFTYQLASLNQGLREIND